MAMVRRGAQHWTCFLETRESFCLTSTEARRPIRTDQKTRIENDARMDNNQ